MREIKFRAWNKYTNTMIRNILVGDRCIIAKRVDEDGDICFTEIETYNDARIDYIPLQYTGLKDKNGVEIYEGDIVKTSRYNNTLDGILGIAIFIRGSFCLRCPEFESNQHVNLCEFGIVGNHLEVIGNIYENKELLDDK